MSESMFNDDQLDYMRSLDRMPMDSKCWCGWYPLNQCPNCKTYAPGKTCADKMASCCAECGCEGKPDGSPGNHRVNCSRIQPLNPTHPHA